MGEQLEDALAEPNAGSEIPVVPCEVLIYMKLAANRRRDQLDVVELLRAGIDNRAARSYLEQHAADLLRRFDELHEEALADK